MAKATPQLWAQAKALFETGKSLSEISSATGIDRALISRKAKKEGWQKGIYQQLIQEPIDCKIVADTLVSTMKVSGVVPYYPTSAVINNTNAQQNNEPMKIIIERDNG
jgi:hypothetical protein